MAPSRPHTRTPSAVDSRVARNSATTRSSSSSAVRRSVVSTTLTSQAGRAGSGGEPSAGAGSGNDPIETMRRSTWRTAPSARITCVRDRKLAEGSLLAAERASAQKTASSGAWKNSVIARPGMSAAGRPRSSVAAGLAASTVASVPPTTNTASSRPSISWRKPGTADGGVIVTPFPRRWTGRRRVRKSSRCVCGARDSRARHAAIATASGCG